jgi:hypothetical protein
LVAKGQNLKGRFGAVKGVRSLREFARSAYRSGMTPWRDSSRCDAESRAAPGSDFGCAISKQM